MKGIAHFASGLCVATFVPGVVADAERGGLLIALGGAAAMLPDFLDFRFARFLERRDADIAPSAEAPNPQAIADALAREIAAARQGKPRVVQLHPTRISVVEWVLYRVRFDVQRGEVVVTLGEREGRAAVGALEYGYDGALDIIELGGPSLKFTAQPNGAVRIEFLPWHRVWSHSLVLAVLLGLMVGMLLGTLAGVVAALGMATHILEDQLGFMGSNLLWPFTRTRTEGLRLWHAGDPAPNTATVWLSLTLILFNLDQARAVPLIDPLPYFALIVVLPTLMLLAYHARRRWQDWRSGLEAEVQRQREAVNESEDR
ncbi:MAG: metal-dependent hydrolase [Anaerolineae bacterium]|nr:metal-dependent hydrolase [Anaerolineae bacterium]